MTTREDNFYAELGLTPPARVTTNVISGPSEVAELLKRVRILEDRMDAGVTVDLSDRDDRVAKLEDHLALVEAVVEAGGEHLNSVLGAVENLTGVVEDLTAVAQALAGRVDAVQEFLGMEKEFNPHEKSDSVEVEASEPEAPWYHKTLFRI